MRTSPDGQRDNDVGERLRPQRFAWFLAGAGWICTGLGVAGIFLPLLPTVPLLLLAAACFARSSPRLYGWLLDHPRLGPLIADYLDGGGIPLRAKVVAIIMIWMSVSLSLYLAVPPGVLRVVVPCVAGAVTVYLLWLPTRTDAERK